MNEFATTQPWILALIAALLGGALGALIMSLLQRRKAGGHTVEQLQSELDDYKEEVGKHFATTSDLFKDMTEKYRDVYNHLASGSQALCEDTMEHTRIEFAGSKALDAQSPQDSSPSTNDAAVEESKPEPNSEQPVNAAQNEALSKPKGPKEPKDPPLGT